MWWPTISSWIYGDPYLLVRNSSKLKEMLAPSNQPTRQVQWSGTPSLAAWARAPKHGLGALPLGQPTFTDPAGNPISSAVCGNPYGFTLPAYERAHGGPGEIYIIQTKNGQAQYSGLFAVPMAAYTGVCGQDEGIYQLTAYDPVTGNMIGQTQFQVLPASSTPSTAGPGMTPGMTPGGPPIPIHATGSLNLNTTTLIALAAGAYLLFARRRG